MPSNEALSLNFLLYFFVMKFSLQKFKGLLLSFFVSPLAFFFYRLTTIFLFFVTCSMKTKVKNKKSGMYALFFLFLFSLL